VLTLKGAVSGEVLNRGLKQIELIRNKGIALDKVLAIFEVWIGRRTIGKVEQGFKVIFLLVLKI